MQKFKLIINTRKAGAAILTNIYFNQMYMCDNFVE